MLLGVAGEGHDVGALEHRAEITSLRVHRGADDVLEMGSVGIDDVVMPVRLEEAAVGGEVALVGGGAVGAVENSKKIGQQVDQHLDQSAGRRRGGTMDAE